MLREVVVNLARAQQQPFDTRFSGTFGSSRTAIDGSWPITVKKAIVAATQPRITSSSKLSSRFGIQARRRRRGGGGT